MRVIYSLVAKPVVALNVALAASIAIVSLTGPLAKVDEKVQAVGANKHPNSKK